MCLRVRSRNNRSVLFCWTSRRSLPVTCLLLCPVLLLVFGCDRACAPKLIGSIECTKASGKVRFSPDGSVLVAQDGGDGLAVWDVNDGQIKARLNNIARVSMDFVFAADGKRLILADISKVRSLDLETGRSVVLYSHEKDVNCLACSPDGRIVSSSALDGSVRIWDLVAGKEVTTIQGNEIIESLVFSPDGRVLMGGGGSSAVPAFGRVWLWDVAGAKKPRTLEGYSHRVKVLAVSPDCNSVATAGDSEDVWVWDIQQAKITAKWKAGFKVVDAITFSRDGRLLVLAGGNGNLPGININPGMVSFKDMATGKDLHSFAALDDLVRSIALSPDGTKLAVSNGDSLETVKIWDVTRVVNRVLPGNP